MAHVGFGVLGFVVWVLGFGFGVRSFRAFRA